MLGAASMSSDSGAILVSVEWTPFKNDYSPMTHFKDLRAVVLHKRTLALVSGTDSGLFDDFVSLESAHA